MTRPVLEFKRFLGPLAMFLAGFGSGMLVSWSADARKTVGLTLLAVAVVLSIGAATVFQKSDKLER